eukprot:628504-Prymnesium_polylepis.1
MHVRIVHACFRLPGPPNLGLSTQFLHSPQSSALHAAHTPHRAERMRLLAPRGLDGLGAALLVSTSDGDASTGTDVSARGERIGRTGAWVLTANGLCSDVSADAAAPLGSASANLGSAGSTARGACDLLKSAMHLPGAKAKSGRDGAARA